MAVVKGTLRPLRNKVLVTDMNFGEETTKAGIVLHSDNGKSSGLHPRWCRVFAVGDEQTEVKVGDWLLMMHGRWTRAHKMERDDGEEVEFFMIDLAGILLIADEKPEDEGVRMNIGISNFNIPG